MTRIRELRKSKGLTQAKLAAILNVDQTAVSKWELGKAYPDMELALRLADYFGVSVDYLLGKEENKPDRKSGFSDDDLRFALFGGDADEITDAQLEEVKRFARFVLERDKDRK